MDKNKQTKAGNNHVHFKNLPPEFRANFSLLAIFIVASLLVVICLMFFVFPILGGWDPLEEPIPTFSTLTEQNATWKERTATVKVKQNGIVAEEGTAFVLESVTIDDRTSDTYLATAYHVVDSNTKEVYLVSENREYKAQVVDFVEELDYALLKIQGEKIFVSPRYSTADDLAEVGIYGNGSGEGMCSKLAYVSRKEYVSNGKLCLEVNSKVEESLLKGMSGSPVFTAWGIVGMLVEGNSSGSLGYALPYSLIMSEYARYRNNETLSAIVYTAGKNENAVSYVQFVGGDRVSYDNGKVSVLVGDNWENIVRVGNKTVNSLVELISVITDYSNLRQYFNNETNKVEYKIEIVTTHNTLLVKVA